VERTAELLIGVLGVLKAGGAYVPLDPSYPAERLKYILEDSGAELVLTQSGLLEQLGVLSERKVVVLDAELREGLLAGYGREEVGREESGVGPTNLAYVIYTSGSTGRPKGVMIEHRNWVNLARSQCGIFGVSAASSVLQFASASFSASVFEIAMALTSGAALHLLRDDAAKSAKKLVEVINERAITHATLPPGLLSALSANDLPSLGTLIVAGERLPTAVATRWRVGRRLFNVYGATEATACASVAEYRGGEVDIGRPIDNVSCYILDRHGALVPPGTVGELHLGGAGVSRGYLNKPELTAEALVPSPFGARGARLYRTGDRARWLPDGKLEFLGRADERIEISGHRIDIGAIEEALAEHPTIAEAVVLPCDAPAGGRCLAAYIVPDKGQKILAERRKDSVVGGCRSHLKERLRHFMLPEAYVVLEKLPRTANGKVDKRAIPPPAPGDFVAQAYVAPRTPAEALMCELWRDALNLRRVSIHDNFFEIGGHSVLAAKITCALKVRLVADLTLRVFFDNPTVAELCETLTSLDATSPGADVAELRAFPGVGLMAETVVEEGEI
jgi:amino acid adenylation domain-containing protein